MDDVQENQTMGTTMKHFRKSAVAAVIGLGAVALLTAPSFAAGGHNAAEAGAPVQRAHMSQDQRGQLRNKPCPTGVGTQAMMGSGMMAPGQGAQALMGSGMMGSGMMGSGMMALKKDLSSGDVRNLLEHRLQMQGNKRLTLGEVKEAGDGKIVADITTVDGSLVERLEVDRQTGQMRDIE